MKLGQQHFERIKQMSSVQKMTYYEIATKLTAEGVVSPTNSPLCDNHISILMLANGYRLRTRKNSVILPQEVDSQSVALNDVAELMTSNLSPRLKVLMLKDLAKSL